MKKTTHIWKVKVEVLELACLYYKILHMQATCRAMIRHDYVSVTVNFYVNAINLLSSFLIYKDFKNIFSSKCIHILPVNVYC